MKRYIKSSTDNKPEYFYIRTFMGNLEVSDNSSGSLKIMNRIAKAIYTQDPRWHVFVACGSFDDWVNLRRTRVSDINDLEDYDLEIPQGGFNSDSVGDDDREYYMNNYNHRKDKENTERLQGNFKGNYRI